MQNGIRVITAMNRKGGCGKTNLIMGLASAAADRGDSVTIFDTDESKSTYKWMQRAKECGNWSSLVNVVPTLSVAVVKEEVEKIFEQPDQEHLILCDTFGGGSEAQDHLAQLSHVLIAPCMLSDNNYEETKETALWYLRLKKRVDNPADVPPFHVVISKMPRVRSENEEIIYQKLLKTMPVIDDFVADRKAYVRLDAEGLLGEVRDHSKNGAVALHLQAAISEMDAILTMLDQIIREQQ